MRSCSRIGCTAIATATALLWYDARVVELIELELDLRPRSVDLCPVHAGRLTPPTGWALSDLRSLSAVPA